ncbi:transglutaminase TgpA family protein [Lysinibacillus piscis]|uniref:Transglutaminase-like domain-containing protein n=1 Tax=Lysinibacillus piscis TaxID=2518931 RepID=A0ABQ5NPG8_9BACI|nr:DUF3488 and transglutaminase-like domain-containing protein [Lysinibacillus sp. KH24]GLC90267.1 hypothetical protein LYSBPC_33940 [Lysinibacillus sp. KH24]
MKKSLTNLGELTFAYIIIFFILREWLTPVMELTNTGMLHLFLVFIGLALVLSLLQIHPLLSGTIKIVYITWFVVFSYSKYPFLSRETIPYLANEWKLNMLAITSGNFGQVTDSFRTILFLALIWMLIYLIHHWVAVRKNIFYFLALTVFFIATLDTFSDYDGKVAIIKVLILGLILTGVLTIERLWIQSDQPVDVAKKWLITLPMIISILFVSVVAFSLPKTGPTWADPVPFIKNVTGYGNGGSGSRTVGYGEDDSQLGGPFQGDDTLVFTAKSQDRHYWRIDTKDTYTSKGWVKSKGTFEQLVYNENMRIPSSLPIGPSDQVRQTEIEMAMPMPFLLQTYGMISVATGDDAIFIQDTHNEKITVQQLDGKAKLLEKYQLTYSKPVYKDEELQLSNPAMLETLSSDFERFLQLPETVPQRVKDLAIRITQNQSSVYEQIKAIERYFTMNSFIYDKNEVAIPAEDEDYVDQFLFETKMGYCDNFSTSMIVLLRSVGIPARWVKGFASGEEGATVNDVKEYHVTNNNAHSWVEAYIPGTGWMEFEPTIGFTSNVNIDYDFTNETPQQEQPVKPEEQPKEQPEKQLEEEKEEHSPKNAIVAGVGFVEIWKWLKYVLIVLSIVLLFTGITLFVKRKTWLPKMHIHVYRRKEADWTNFDASYQVLVKQLARIGLRRKDGETLRVFAERVDAALETDEMSTLTAVYEQYIYGNSTQTSDFIKLKEIWENLINRTIG